MSCQQAARLISTPSPVTPEDPYVFTETVPTSPILFNTQKSARSRLTDNQVATTNTVSAKSNCSQQKLTFAQLNGNIAKAQASLVVAGPIIGAVTSAVTPNTTPANISIKNVTQSQKQTIHVQPKQPLQQQNNIINPTNNVSIADLHTQQEQQQQHQPGNQSTQLFQHTPSLWQTPLLLDTTPLVSPPTSPASLPSPTAASATQTFTGLLSSSLPPSKFHHTTLAQHLQKLQCIKNPKKSISINNNNTNNNKNKSSSNAQQDFNAFENVSEPPPLQALEQQKHSDTNLNEIPAVAINTKPASTNKIKQNSLSNGSIASTLSAATVESNIISTAEKSSTLQQTTQVPKLVELRKSNENVINTTKDENCFTRQPRLQQTTLQNLLTVHELSSEKKISNEGISKLESKITNNLVNKELEESLHAPNLLDTPKTSKKCKTNLETNSTNATSHLVQKKILNSSGFQLKRKFPAIDSVEVSSKNAVAVVKISAEEADTDTSVLASPYVLPYCLQKHWINVLPVQSAKIGREERIVKNKNLLQRQALQLLSTNSMQKYPLHLARQRLLCVDRLIRKYKNCLDDSLPVKKCTVQSCTNDVMEMAIYCEKHVTIIAAQRIFSPCTARLSDNTQCRTPVFDIKYDIPLCKEHAQKRFTVDYSQKANERSKLSKVSYIPQNNQNSLQQTSNMCVENKKLNTCKVTQARKRKTASVNPVGRPQKRTKKLYTAPIVPAPIPVSTVMQRKNSTTSLESIASNSHSSNSQLPFVSSNSLAPPALAPLSHNGNMISPQRLLNFGTLDGNFVDEKKAHDINQIVAQFTMLAKNHENNYNNNPAVLNNNNNNMNFMNTNSDSNFTSGLGSTSSLPSTDEFLAQDMLSMCDNSSAYASSEDTGLGGLSENEPIANVQEDEIPLDDTHLLEENDLANVLNSLPVDAFNELFTAVRQDECDEVERALALADKHLKSLQQTIGSDSDFLGDFLDVNDDFLNDVDICSKIDTSALFIDNVGNGGSASGGTTGNCSSIPDVRGLVQT